MRILIDLTHPAHVHFFKYAARIWQEHGHQVAFAARDKEIILDLLEAYDIPYRCLSSIRKGLFGLGIELIEHETGLIKFAKRFNPDLILNIGGTFIVHAGKLLGVRTCVFTDTEHATLSNRLTFPFATWVCTPKAYNEELGPKQIRYVGYQELAYLHPNYFEPDPKILYELGLSSNDHYFLLRFVSWGASHDFGKRGLSDTEKIQLVKQLEPYGRVIITSEMALPAELEPYRMTIGPIFIHDLLYYASLYLGEGATMAAEAAILGTPSIYINPLSAGTIDELSNEYHLIFQHLSFTETLATALQILKDSSIKDQYVRNHRRMLEEKIDVTEWLVDFIEKKSTISQSRK